MLQAVSGDLILEGFAISIFFQLIMCKKDVLLVQDTIKKFFLFFDSVLKGVYSFVFLSFTR